MTIDVLLASAALPQLFQAVEIDGEPYWDGGYSGNPTLWPMIHSGIAPDLVVVQLVPDTDADTPTDAVAIRRRVGEIVFNSSLVAEMQAIAAMRAFASRDARTPAVHDLRLHRVGPPSRELLAEGSSLERSHAWIHRLHREGRAAARNFVARHGGDIGVRETLDVTRVFGGQHKPRLPLPANEAAFDGAAAAGGRTGALARALQFARKRVRITFLSYSASVCIVISTLPAANTRPPRARQLLRSYWHGPISGWRRHSPPTVRREFDRGLLRLTVALHDAHIERVGRDVDRERRRRRGGRHGGG